MHDFPSPEQDRMVETAAASDLLHQRNVSAAIRIDSMCTKLWDSVLWASQIHSRKLTNLKTTSGCRGKIVLQRSMSPATWVSSRGVSGSPSFPPKGSGPSPALSLGGRSQLRRRQRKSRTAQPAALRPFEVPRTQRPAECCGRVTSWSLRSLGY